VRIALRLACVAVLGAAGCAGGSAAPAEGRLVVTTVSPITDIVRNVAGDRTRVVGVVPEGVDSHTFEPTSESARVMAGADLVLVNGLRLDDSIAELAHTGAPDTTPVVALGDRAIESTDYVYDFSFPRAAGRPNPHLWMSVPLAIEYAQETHAQLAQLDPGGADAYASNARRYGARLEELDAAIRATVETIPPDNRVLLTYHDSFAYFAEEYGFRVIGAIQPADFAEPSAREVAELVDQIRDERVPAIFGSEVFPSPVLEQIARETGVTFEGSLRDDDLPGEPGDAQHSYIGLMSVDVGAIAEALGGDSSALDGIAAPEDAP
jgi:ABC-type Zn uptake system ZnuABC Zn-binding protein ZnuA